MSFLFELGHVALAEKLISRIVNMSDETSSRIEKVKKPRAPMTEAQKAGLAKGRAKLAASRQAVKDRVMNIEDDPINAVEPVRKSTKKPQRVVVEDDSESEPEEIHVIRRRTKKPQKKVVYHSEDEASEDEEEEVKPQGRNTPPAPAARRATARPSRARAATPPPREEGEPFTVRFF